MDRNIFSFSDGTTTRYVDPIAAERILSAYLDGNAKLYTEKSISAVPEESIPAMNRIKQAICAAFSLSPFDPTTGQGCTEDAILAVFDAFAEWRQKKNQSTAGSPTLPPSSASQQPSNVSAPIQTTKSFTASP